MQASMAPEAAVQVRRAQKAAELCAGQMRAYSGQADLHFQGDRLFSGARALPWYAPHLQPANGQGDFVWLRGMADAVALRLQASDDALHQRLQPDHPVERLIFGLLEQYRVESLVPDTHVGMRRNMRHLHDQWALAYHHAGHTETARGLLLYSVAQICRARVCAEPVLEATEDLIESTRFALASSVGHQLAGLRRERHDQAAYAVHARALAISVAASMDSEEETAPAGADRQKSPRHDLTQMIAEMQALETPPPELAKAARSRALGEMGTFYKVYSRAYDLEQSSTSMVRPALLTQYRSQLDRRIARQGVNMGRLAHRLRRCFSHPRMDGWEDGQESGRVDGRRLSQLVASPYERRLFKTERSEAHADAVVSFLIDCSGSMKDRAESVAMLVDVFARALELAGAASEILGFTTGAWNGGRARRDWQKSGRPARPGRLNEVSHLIFKPADSTWRQSRPAVSALLKSDLFREGVDGEAVMWACGRLAQRPEQRKVLFVISDGSPLDGATLLANDDGYLDAHLKAVVQAQAEAGVVDVVGVGVGLDLSPYYRHSRVIDLEGGLGNQVFLELLELIER